MKGSIIAAVVGCWSISRKSISEAEAELERVLGLLPLFITMFEVVAVEVFGVIDLFVLVCSVAVDGGYPTSATRTGGGSVAGKKSNYSMKE